ncbi:MAG: lytic transglycosylase domain-containing protein [Paludibacteraceae bacterium]|nr:lytic transglycosylase domain-containing protein [Paludibacteraceae bacterium]
MGIATFAQAEGNGTKWDNLIKAISEVESRGNTNAVSGHHVGILQISPILVKDCNRINRLKGIQKQYALNDRYDKRKSIEMFNIIQEFYNPNRNIEKAVRLWNGGPKATTKSTQGYLERVMKALREIEKSAKR